MEAVKKKARKLYIFLKEEFLYMWTSTESEKYPSTIHNYLQNFPKFRDPSSLFIDVKRE